MRQEKKQSGNKNTLVSKKGATVWNNITQVDCKEEAKKFINNENVKSALCSGIQWDVTMEFVDGKEDGAGNIFDVTIYNKDRHERVIRAISGENEADKVCNIYDIEGNFSEYTAERNACDENRTFIRRAAGYYSADNSPACKRGTSSGGAFVDGTFRFVMYVM